MRKFKNFFIQRNLRHTNFDLDILNDVEFFQRPLAINSKKIVKTFIFAIIPISLSILGFIGAGMAREGILNVTDPQMIGPEVISVLLPKEALYAFFFMAIAGLSSTLDSTFCAISSLTSIDIYKSYINKNANDKKIIKVSRISMLIIAIIGTSISLLKPKLLWIFLIYGAMGPAILFPAIFSVYTKKLKVNYFISSVLISFLIGTPTSIYANVTENSTLIVISSLIAIIIGFFVCLLGVVKNRSYV